MKKRKLSVCCALLLSGLLCVPATGYATGSLSDEGVARIMQQEGKRVTINLKNATMKELLHEIHLQTGLDFIYNNEQFADLGKITVKVENELLEKVFAKVFEGKAYEYRIKGKIVTINKRKIDPNKVYSLQGFVYDAENHPVIGATVMIKGTHTGVVTDTDGRYEIKVKPGQMLSFSYLGMEPMDVEYTGMTFLDIFMKYDKKTTLDNVVVTGIFTKPRESYTGSVSMVTNEQLKLHKGQNLLQTLKNIDASINFTVNNLAGSNPNVLPSINIRGNSSLPVSVSEFNENMKNETNTPLILKDASATAIYGSRGANGVIVVTTKKPESGRLKINMEIGTNIQVPDLSSYNLLNAAEKLQLEFDAGLYNDSQNPTNHNALRAIYNKRYKAILSGANTDWIKKPVRTGVGQRYNARLEGGNEEFRWGTSLSYNDIAGVMKGSSRRTFNGSITLMYEMKNLIFRNYTSFGFNHSKESEYGSFSDYVSQQPYNVPYDENGKLVHYFDSFNGKARNVQNPLYDAMLNSFDKTAYQEVINNFSIEWTILEGLIMRGQLGLSTTHNTSDKFLPAEHSTFVDYTSEEDFLRRGSYDYGEGRTTMYDANLTLSYSKLFADKHQFYAGLNADIAEEHMFMNYFRAEGFSNEEMDKVMNAMQYALNGKPTGYDMKTRRLSLTGNLNYTFDNRYYLDLSYRVDGSSEFGSDKKYAPFWSSGLGWNIHNERFMKDKTPFNALRLKFSYGQTGSVQNSSTGANTVYEYLTGNRYMNWNGTVLQGLGNSNLTWQKTDQFNAGFEFGVWENRIKGSFDIYTKKTSNLLSYMNLPLSMGFSSYLANVGEVKNNGWEASASAYLIRDRQRDINLILSGQLTYNKNEITKLSEAIKAQNEEYMKQGADVSNLFFEGYPQNSIYAVQSLGIDPSTGEEVFLDKNGNKVNEWNAADKVFQGSSDPKYRGNLSSALIWKNFTFNMSWGFYWGGKRYNSTLLDRVEVTLADLKNSNVDERVLSQRWYKPGDLTFFKKLSALDTRASSRYVMDDNVFELQSISLQYRWDTPGLKKAIGANSIIFGVNMSDIFHFSTIKMERGTSYPFARSIQGSVKLSF